MIDERDLFILNELRKNARLSSRALAKKVGLPISTVHRRIKRMEKEGIIKGYYAAIDFEKIGKPIEALILINLAEGREYIPLEQIKKELKGIGEIMEILVLQGGNIDLITKVRLPNLKNLSSFLENIRKLEGIEEVSCSIVAEELS
ncbi:MAG: Lrp/AsnC family transcriptional regulator [Candidatus Aenigmatarchaeota archaeon]